MTDVKLDDDDVCTVATILCRQAGWDPDGLYSVDDGPLLKGWNHFENKARASLSQATGGELVGCHITMSEAETGIGNAVLSPDEPADGCYWTLIGSGPEADQNRLGRQIVEAINHGLSAAPAAPVGEGFQAAFEAHVETMKNEVIPAIIADEVKQRELANRLRLGLPIPAPPIPEGEDKN